MAELIKDFQRPDKVTQLEAKGNKGSFEFKPLEPGYGLTIGNALRRVLLSSLEGFAITSVRIMGVDHEFSTIPGVIEDVTRILLNLKQVRFKQKSEGTDEETVRIKLEGKEEFKAGDLQDAIQHFEILNPDLHLFSTDGKVKVDMHLTIEKGRGYVTVEENKRKDVPLGTIFMDSIHTPIKHVKYAVENYRVGQKTDYERLIIEVETDGSISPRAALTESAKILIQHFVLFSDEKISVDDTQPVNFDDDGDENFVHMRKLFNTKIEELSLGVRTVNCLAAADIRTLGDLVQYNKSDLLKLRNFGQKSLKDLEKLIEERGLTFGMDLSKYKK